MPPKPIELKMENLTKAAFAEENNLAVGQLKILFVTKDTTLFKDGSISRNLMKDYSPLVDQLHIVVLCHIGHGFRIEKIAPNVWLYPTNSITSLMYPLDAKRVVRGHIVWKHRLQANLVSAEDPFDAGLSAWLIAKKYKKRLHLEIDADFLDPHYAEEGMIAEWRTYLAKYVASKAVRVTAASDKIRSSIIQALNMDANKIDVLPPFVDIEGITREPVKVDLHIKYPDAGFIILMNTRLSREKNVALAIKVVERLVRVYPKTTLLIVGEGHQKSYLHSLVRKLNLTHNVFFETHSEDLFSYYKTAHVNLITSDYEDHGAPIITALACSCPVVATLTPVTRSIFGDLKYNHYLCPVGDVDGLTAKIRELMEVTGARDDYKVNAKYIIEDLLPYTKEEYLNKVKDDWRACFAVSDVRAMILS